MIFGILKDIKEEEFRVICTPMEVHSIRAAGHEVWAQHDCGKLAGFPDEAYAAAKHISFQDMHFRTDIGRTV